MTSPVLHPSSPEAAIVPLKSSGPISIPIGFVDMLGVVGGAVGDAKKREADQVLERIRLQATTGVDPGAEERRLAHV